MSYRTLCNISCICSLPFPKMFKHFFTKSPWFTLRKYTTTTIGELSYFHTPGSKPLICTTFPRILEQTYSLYGDREAVVDCEQNLRKTYREYIDDIEKLAAGFISLGLERGDRVGIFAPNSYQWLLVEYAAIISGLILVGINPTSKPKELEHCLKLTGVKALIAAEKVRDNHLYPVIRTTIPEMGGKTPGSRIQSDKFPNLDSIVMISKEQYDGTLRLEDVASKESCESRRKLAELKNTIQTHDPVYILFTSGSTGLPKGCFVSQHSTTNTSYFHGIKLGLDKKDHVFCLSSPMFHALGLAPSFSCMLYGHKLVFPSSSYSVQKMLQALHTERCTLMFGTPTMYIDILNHKDLHKYDLTDLDIGVIGGASTSPETFKHIYKKFGVSDMTAGYGCTEATFIISITERGDPLEYVQSTVGKVFEHLEVKIVDGKGNLVPWGTPGEILVRGFSTMLGYWNDPEKTRQSFTEDRFYKTGDVATLKPDGTMTIVGRIKDMILRGGENVYPKEIEDVIVLHPKVMEAHVFGIPEERLGEVVCAWVCPKQGQKVTPEEIISFCQREMAAYKVPLHVKIVNEFPKLGSGKVNKFEMTKTMSEMNVKKP